jgi:NNP family nitrate/nitrite transporter-like MFS transporter
VLRIPYTFAVPRFGGRAWTTASAALLFIPTLLLAVVVPSGWLLHWGHSTQLWVLWLCAATAGVGGGNFSSSMANISFFYPERKKGWALGLNAAGGNLGVAVAQLLVPLAVIVGVPAAAVKLPQHHVHLAYAGLMWLPFIAVASICAWRYMDSLTQAKADTGSYVAALRYGQTWVMSFLYIGTFGSFIGFSFALPLVIKNTFPEFLAGHPFIATYLAGLGFMGALIGSLARPLGGLLSDRVGGARVTLAVFVGMAAATAAAIGGVQQRSFGLFFGSYMVIFLLSGVGNGSTYKMIPSIFALLGLKEAAERGHDPRQAAVEFKRRAAAVIGIAGAIGAFGGVLIQVVLRQSSLQVSALVKAAKSPAEKVAVAAAHADWSVPALWVFLASYLVFAAVTWLVYLRTASSYAQRPALAGGAV